MSLVLTSRELDAWSSQSDDGPDDEFLGILSDTDTDDGIIVLLDIRHESLSQPMLFCSSPKEFLFFHDDTQEPVHGLTFDGEQYLWCAFAFVLTKEPESGAMGTAQITMENIDPIITETIREIDTAPDFFITLVRKNDTTRAQMRFDYLKLTNVSVNYSEIRGTLSDYDFLSEVLPEDTYTLSIFRGLA